MPLPFLAAQERRQVEEGNPGGAAVPPELAAVSLVFASAEVEREAEAIAEIWRRADEWGDWSDLFDPGATELVRPAMELFKAALRSLARSDDPARIDAIRGVLREARQRIRALDDQAAC